MRDFLFNNRTFYILFGTIWLLGVGYWLSSDKGQLLYWFSSNRSSLLNVLFPLWTRLGEAWVFVVLFLVFLIRRMDRALAVSLGGIITLSISTIMKFIFEVPRPRLWLLLRGELRSFNAIADHPIRDGYNSFPSGHTMGAFVLACLLSMMFPKYKYLFLVLAVGVGISRIYLGHHFIEDVLMGSIIGILIGSTVFIVTDQLKGQWKRGVTTLRVGKAGDQP